MNNEIGTIQPIKEAVDIIKAKNPKHFSTLTHPTHTAESPSTCKTSKLTWQPSAATKSKVPRGMGAMYLKEGVNLERIIEGQIGTQKLWPGIENTPLIVGFTKASELAFENFEANTAKMRKLRDQAR